MRIISLVSALASAVSLLATMNSASASVSQYSSTVTWRSPPCGIDVRPTVGRT